MITKPSKATIGRMAERQPELLNPLVAFFVFGWQGVIITQPMHGCDQTGTARMLPDYVGLIGVDQCVSWLLEAPQVRKEGNDCLSVWCEKIGSVC